MEGDTASSTTAGGAGSGRQLSQVQISEIRKAFVLCDSDGSGAIDRDELAKALAMLSGSSEGDTESVGRSRHEVEALFSAMDTNGDGVIEWDEFLEAMRGWFFDDFSGNSGSSGQGERARADVHNRISSFFTQFRSTSDIHAVRARLAQDSEESSHLNEMMVDGLREEMSSDEKLQYLENHRLTVSQNLQTVLHTFVAPPVQQPGTLYDPGAQQEEAAEIISQLLGIVEVFHSPQERRAVADDVVGMFKVVVDNQLVRPIVQLLSSTTSASMQVKLLRIISLLLPGPRIASTPVTSPLHPGQYFFKKLFLNEGLLAVLASLMTNSLIPEVKIQAVVALGALVAHNPEVRDHVLQQGGLTSLLSIITTTSPVELLRPLSAVLAIFTGVTHPMDHLPPLDWISPALPSMTSLLFVTDEQILINICPAIAIVLPGIPEMAVCRRLVDLVKATTQPQAAVDTKTLTRLQLALVQCISNLVRFDNVQTQIFLNNCSLLLALRDVLDNTTDRDVRLEICDFFLILAGVKGEIQATIDAGLVTRMMTMMKVDDYLKPKLAKILKYVSRGAPQHVAYCVEAGLVSTLCRSLTFFKTFDRVLTRVYKYVGPTYNFEFARDVIVALDNIVNVGEMEAEATRLQMSPAHRRVAAVAHNPYALQHFDLESIADLSRVLDEISENPDPSEVNTWRERRPGDTSLEEKIKVLIWKVAKVHVSAASTDSEAMAKMVEAIFRKHFGWTGANEQNEEMGQDEQAAPDVESAGSVTRNLEMESGLDDLVLIKADLDNDIRIVQVQIATLKFNELVKSLEFKFGIDGMNDRLKLTYLDSDGDHITISDDSGLQQALQSSRIGASQRTLKVYVEKFSRNQQDSFEPSSVERTKVGKRSRADEEALEHASLPQSPLSGENAAPMTAKIPKNSDVLRLSSDSGTQQAAASEQFAAALGDIKHDHRADVYSSLSHTNFGAEELEQMKQNWMTKSPSGEIDREQFSEGLRSIGITDPLLIEQYFSAFDHDRNGKIDFAEFATGLSIVQRGSVEERLRFMFDAYDLDKNGVLTFDELFKLLKAAAAVRGDELARNSAKLNSAVAETFAAVDTDGNGEIDFEEFCHAVHQQKLPISELFVNLEGL